MKLRFFCIMFALVLALCACGGAGDGAVTTEPPVTEAPIPAGPPVVLSGYTLIRSENAERAVIDAASALYSQIQGVEGGLGVGHSLCSHKMWCKRYVLVDFSCF